MRVGPTGQHFNFWVMAIKEPLRKDRSGSFVRRPSTSAGSADAGDVLGRRPLLTLHDVELDLLALIE